VIVADTSIWIDFFKAKDEISSLMRFELKRNNILAVEVIFGELLQGAKTKRESSIIKSYWKNLSQATLPNTWIAAGEYASTHKTFAKGVGLIDVAIYIIAKSYDAKIWTLDKKLISIFKRSEIAY